jgi:hypothetical protein
VKNEKPGISQIAGLVGLTILTNQIGLLYDSYLAPGLKTGFGENDVAKKAEFFVEKPGFLGLVENGAVRSARKSYKLK